MASCTLPIPGIIGFAGLIPAPGIISTIAGTGQAKFYGDNGPAVKAALNEPVALVLDGPDCLYIADQSNNRIRKLDVPSGVITTVAGTGESGYNGDGAAGPETALGRSQRTCRGSGRKPVHCRYVQ